MHALVRQGNGKYYVSYVFGYYKNVTAKDGYENYMENIHKPYFIVWDEKKEKLIRLLACEPNPKFIIPQLILVDSDEENWIENEGGEGCVDFLTKELIDSIIFEDQTPSDEILEKCRNADIGYQYEEYREIRTEKDMEDFRWGTRNFHDAHIVEEILQDDGTLYLKFEGLWVCSVELWFWGDLEYDTSARDPENYDPYWFSSTLLMKDGFIYFMDEDGLTAEDAGPGCCYFKAMHMKYHIIPQ